MSWYYSRGSDKVGPVDLSEISSLISTGQIVNETLLWKEGMPDWKPYGEMRTSPELFVDSERAICVESGVVELKENMVRFGNVYVSAACKDAYMQKIQAGAVGVKELEFAEIWMRFVAKIVDNIIIGFVNTVIMFGVGVFIGLSNPDFGSDGTAMGSVLILLVSYVVVFGLGAVYNLIFLPKYGATPGKMACGIKVVNPDGTYISKGKAVGRFFAEILNSLTLGIGYLIAVFDDEKRGLHDRLCDTRVVNK